MSRAVRPPGWRERRRRRGLPFPERFGGAALVTGASSGIGRELARSFARRGTDVVLVARRRQRLEELAAELSTAHGVRALVLDIDLSRTDAAEAVWQGTNDAHIHIGVVANNAGFGERMPFESQTEDYLARLVDVNCRTPLLLTRRYLPPMLERHRGGLIFVASTAAYQPVPWLAAYAATKSFDLQLAESLWGEYHARGIDVLGLAPGFTPTEFQGSAFAATRQPYPPTTAAQVAESALHALGHKATVVPGFANAGMAIGVRFVPRAVTARLAARVLRPR